MASPDPTLDFQIHHILPTQLFNNETLRLEIADIFGDSRVLQSYNNRIALFTGEAKADIYKSLQTGENLWSDVAIGATQHSGYHSAYNKAVETWVENLLLEQGLTPEQKKLAIIDFQAELKDGLAKGEIALYGDTAADSIKNYIEQHAITTEQLTNNGERLVQAEERLAAYTHNDTLYADLKNDPVSIDSDGKLTVGDNKLFTQEIGKQIAEKALASDMHLTNEMRADLEKIASGEVKSGFNELRCTPSAALSHLLKP